MYRVVRPRDVGDRMASWREGEHGRRTCIEWWGQGMLGIAWQAGVKGNMTGHGTKGKLHENMSEGHEGENLWGTWHGDMKENMAEGSSGTFHMGTWRRPEGEYGHVDMKVYMILGYEGEHDRGL